MFDQHLPARCKMSIANAKIIILQSLHRTTFGQVSNRKARSSQTLKSQLEDLFEDTRVGIGCRVYRRIFWRWYLQNMCIVIYIHYIYIYIYIQRYYVFVKRHLIFKPSKHFQTKNVSTLPPNTPIMYLFFAFGQQGIRVFAFTIFPKSIRVSKGNLHWL